MTGEQSNTKLHVPEVGCLKAGTFNAKHESFTRAEPWDGLSVPPVIDDVQSHTAPGPRTPFTAPTTSSSPLGEDSDTNLTMSGPLITRADLFRRTASKMIVWVKAS